MKNEIRYIKYLNGVGDVLISRVEQIDDQIEEIKYLEKEIEIIKEKIKRIVLEKKDIEKRVNRRVRQDWNKQEINEAKLAMDIVKIKNDKYSKKEK